MTRADWKAAGKHTASETETASIYEAQAGWRDSYGDWLGYYHLDRNNSNWDDVYAEALSIAYLPMIKLPVMHVVFNPSGNEQGEGGFYFNDAIVATIPYDLFSQSGLPFASMNPQGYDNDRCLYDRKVFRVTKLTAEGKIQKQPTTISLEATQLKPDENHDDPEMFALIQANLGGGNL